MNPTVLIVDDHEAFRLQARAMLEDEGYRVVGEAETGEGAIEAARELRPQLVLLDVQLPDIDGFEVAARLAIDAPEINVVLTSGRDGEDYGSALAKAKTRGFIAKRDLSGESLTRLVTGNQ